MDWKVRFIDYPTQFARMETEILETVKTVFSQGDLILRRQLQDFEKHFAEFTGSPFAVGTSNCTDALRLSLMAAGIGQGDEVITVSHTFVATISSIYHVGAVPVLIDIGDDHNMDVNLIQQAMTPKTKAIVPVHLNGRLCDMPCIMAIAEEHGLVVIEDAAQALGASLNGKRGGSFGLAGCFSFYPAKILGAFGDAGAVTTPHREIAQKLRSLRDHGRNISGEIDGWSFNCRMDNLQAALLDLKLRHLSEWIARRREIALRYHHRLSNLRQLCLPIPPRETDSYYDVFQNYVIEARDPSRLVSFLRDCGIEILLPWGGKGVHQFRALGLDCFRLPRTERMLQNTLMLPVTPELADEQVDYVTDKIQEFYNL